MHLQRSKGRREPPPVIYRAHWLPHSPCYVWITRWTLVVGQSTPCFDVYREEARAYLDLLHPGQSPGESDSIATYRPIIFPKSRRVMRFANRPFGRSTALAALADLRRRTSSATQITADKLQLCREREQMLPRHDAGMPAQPASPAKMQLKRLSRAELVAEEAK